MAGTCDPAFEANLAAGLEAGAACAVVVEGRLVVDLFGGMADLDVPLRRFWPELRIDPTVRQALSHQAGIPILDDLPPGAILGLPIARTLGYERTPAWADDGRPPHCWGSPGGGGVVTFADPGSRVGFAYLNNASWSGAPGADPRAAALTRALYSCL